LRINKVLGVQVPPSAHKNRKDPRISPGVFSFNFLDLVARGCAIYGVANAVNAKAVG
jgi:hypothetical protein